MRLRYTLDPKLRLTYHVWRTFVARCTKPYYRDYAAYGGRGITVNPRWLSFKNFLADMGPKPLGLTLERKDNNKGYSKDNCKWATYLEQSLNKRNSVKQAQLDKAVELWRAGYTQEEAAQLVGVGQSTLSREFRKRKDV